MHDFTGWRLVDVEAALHETVGAELALEIERTAPPTRTQPHKPRAEAKPSPTPGEWRVLRWHRSETTVYLTLARELTPTGIE